MEEITPHPTAPLRLGGFEEKLLLAVAQLRGQGYGVTLRREVEERTGQPTSLSLVYLTLDRLERKGFVRSHLGDPTPERGGRAKRFYRIEGAGELALTEAERMRRQLRAGLTLGMAGEGG